MSNQPTADRLDFLVSRLFSGIKDGDTTRDALFYALDDYRNKFELVSRPPAGDTPATRSGGEVPTPVDRLPIVTDFVLGIADEARRILNSQNQQGLSLGEVEAVLVALHNKGVFSPPLWSDAARARLVLPGDAREGES